MEQFKKISILKEEPVSYSGGTSTSHPTVEEIEIIINKWAKEIGLDKYLTESEFK